MLQMAFSNPQEAARWGREVVSPFLADEVRLRSELGAFAYYLKHEVSPPADYRSMTCPMTDTKELAILDHDSPYDTFCRLVEESGFFDLLYQHPEVAIGGSEFSNAYSFPNLEAFIEDQRAVPIRLVYEVYREHHRTLESRGNHMTFNRFNSSVRKRPAPGFGKVVSTVFRAPMGLKHYVRVELTEEGMAEARIFFARKSGNAEKHRELATRAKQAEA
jgi:hypothetical protein